MLPSKQINTPSPQEEKRQNELSTIGSGSALVRSERQELQVCLLSSVFTPLFEEFRKSDGEDLSVVPRKDSTGFGYRKTWVAKGRSLEGLAIFETRSYEHRYGWSDSEHCNIDYNYYKLDSISAANSIGTLTIPVAFEIDKKLYSGDPYVTPRALTSLYKPLKVDDSTIMLFEWTKPGTGDEGLSLRLGDLNKETKNKMSGLLSSFCDIWMLLGTREKIRQEEKAQTEAIIKEAEAEAYERRQLKDLCDRIKNSNQLKT